MTLEDLVKSSRFTILLGKNGAGKSTHLRILDGARRFKSKYISPERGGVLKYDPNVDFNISSNAQWMAQDRRKNRTEQFRPQSAVQFRSLEMLVLREIESDPVKRSDSSYTFDSTLSRINQLLPSIELRRADRGFSITDKQGNPIQEDQLSSGESELIALAIEVLVYARESGSDKVLMMDEPDVHLHPDLQQRFIHFVVKTAQDFDFRVVVATHSTAVIGAFGHSEELQISPVLSRNQTDFKSFSYSDICHSILPIFGAHPLSAQFNRSPPLLVEGDDDRRVIDQTVRSSGGKYVYSVCVVGTVDQMAEWEAWLNTFLPSIYDDPKGYSLRDLDDSQQSDINDLNYVRRARLNCYAMENILLCDESLESCGHSATTFLDSMKTWQTQYPNHAATPLLTQLIGVFQNRRTTKMKDVRNLIVGLLGITKPWEVHVGQLIASNFDRNNPSSDALRSYLGPGALTKIFPP